MSEVITTFSYHPMCTAVSFQAAENTGRSMILTTNLRNRVNGTGRATEDRLLRMIVPLQPYDARPHDFQFEMEGILSLRGYRQKLTLNAVFGPPFLRRVSNATGINRIVETSSSMHHSFYEREAFRSSRTPTYSSPHQLNHSI